MKTKTLNILFKKVMVSFVILSMPLLAFSVTQSKEKLKSETSSFSNLLKYSYATDVFDENEGTLAFHGVEYVLGYKVTPTISTNIKTTAAYATVDNYILQGDDGAVDLQVSDVNLNLSISGKELSYRKSHKFIFNGSIGNIFPLSKYSRDEGYKAIPNLSGGISYSYGFLNSCASFSQLYVANSYEKRLYETPTAAAGTANLLAQTTGSFGIGASLYNVNFNYSYFFGVQNYTDSTNLGFSGNSVSISSNIKNNFLIAMKVANRSRIDDPFVDLFFYNQRLILSLSIGVKF